MTDLQYTLATPTSGRDVTAVMGRRVLAWILDFLLYMGFAIALYAILADYVDISDGTGFLDACDRLQLLDGDAAAGCIEIGDKAYITSNSDNGIQTLASLGYLLFFIAIQGVLGGSPGKLLTGLRVVDEHGKRAGIGRSFVRTLLWVVDAAPWFLPLVGLITGITTTGHRRVGDMAAKTYVVARSDTGQPVTTGAPVTPPAQSAWGAPPTQWAPPAGPPAAPAADPATNMPGPPTTTSTPTPTVSDMTPDVSGVPADEPAPPPMPDNAAPTWTPPGLDDIGPVEPAAPTDEVTMPEIDGPVDIAAPEVEANDDWWAGPEASPESDAPETMPTDGPPEMPAWEDPTPAPDTAGDTWAPPTTPGSDIDEAENTSPTAGPAPFTAPGADPVVDAPTAPEPAPRPPPQWDQARNTYIQWEPALQKWLQWDEPAQRWKDIDT